MTTSAARDAARSAIVVLASVLCTLAVFGLTGYDVPDIVSGLLNGSVGSHDARVQTIRWAVPLFLVALGVGFSFRAGLFNVGAQGQLYVGSIAGLIVALAGDGRAPWLFVPLGLLAGAAAGAGWSLLAGVLRVRLGADELVTSLMLNFIAVLLLEWVATGPLKSSAGSGQAATTRAVPDGYRITDGTGVSAGVLLVCLVLLVGAAVLLHRTRTGLDLRIVGRNPVMAHWVGLSSPRLTLLAFALTGATAGLAGVIEGFGPAGSLRAGYSPAVGFMAVIVAIVASFDPMRTLIVALFFGALQAATLYLPIVSDVPQVGFRLITGIVALLITVRNVPRLRRSRRDRTAAPDSGRGQSAPRELESVGG